MVETVDITIQQGDTTRLITAPLDNDNPSNKFLDVSNVTVEFALKSSEANSPELATGDVTTGIEQFSNTRPGVGSYEGIDTIADSQNLVVVTIPAADTASLLPGEFTYQVRLSGTDRGTVTLLRGTATVESTPLE